MTLSKNQMFGISSKSVSAVTRNCGEISHADRFGTDLAIRPKTVPPVSEYNAYVQAAQRRKTHYWHRSQRFEGVFLRRAVIMRRQGETWSDIGRAIGVAGTTIKNWVEFLPLELQP